MSGGFRALREDGRGGLGREGVLEPQPLRRERWQLTLQLREPHLVPHIVASQDWVHVWMGARRAISDCVGRPLRGV